MTAERIAEIRRTTKETDITVKLNLESVSSTTCWTGSPGTGCLILR